MNNLNKARRSHIQQFTRDKIAPNKTHYSIGLNDFYLFYNWWEDKKYTEKQYVALIKKYMDEMTSFWIEHPEFDLKPQNHVGIFGIRRFRCQSACPLSKFQYEMIVHFRKHVKKSVMREQIFSSGWQYALKWFHGYPSAFFKNQKIYNGKPVTSLATKFKEKRKSMLAANKIYESKIGNYA